MNRRQLMIAGGIFSTTALLYCLSFGPVVYAISLAARHQVMPNWLSTPYTVIFRPHLWVMYHSDSYFSYVAWFGHQGGSSIATGWQDYRDGYMSRFGDR